MKFFAIAAFAFIAMTMLPSADAWYVSCGDFNSFKSDVGRYFSYRDSRINSLFSTASQINSKVYSISNTVNGFSATTRRMEDHMKAQERVNADLKSQMAHLTSRNSALRADLEKFKKELDVIVKKNCDQDSHIISLLRHNTMQDSRMASIERANHDQQTQINAEKSLNEAQERSIDDIKMVNGQQNDRLSSLEQKDAAQDNSITALQTTNSNQDVALGKIEQVNADQSKKIEDLISRNEAQDAKIGELLNTLTSLTSSIAEMVKSMFTSFSSTVNKCIFADDMLKCMTEPAPLVAYQYTRYGAINAQQLLERARGN